MVRPKKTVLAVSPLSPKLLVSVQNVRESVDALAGGADWIDVKQPAAGSLGRPKGREVAEIVEQVADRLPVSVALGELSEFGILEEVTRLPLIGVDRVKIGLSACRALNDWQGQLNRLIAILPPPTSFVAVQYADWQTCDAPSPAELIEFARNTTCSALLIDTFDKNSGGLFDWTSEEELTRLFTDAHALNLTCVAAGSLTTEVFTKAINVGADVLAVRGAACDDRERTSAISIRQVRRLRDFLSNTPAEIS